MHAALTALFLIAAQGIDLSTDSVWDASLTWMCPGSCSVSTSVAVRNTGVAQLLLDSVRLDVDETMLEGVALGFVGPDGGPDCFANTYVTFNGAHIPPEYNSDYTAGRPQCRFVLPPNDSVVLDHFDIDVCFCLVKASSSAFWQPYDTIALPVVFYAGDYADTLHVIGVLDFSAVAPEGVPAATPHGAAASQAYTLLGRQLPRKARSLWPGRVAIVSSGNGMAQVMVRPPALRSE
jgi:hypothetical protein